MDRDSANAAPQPLLQELIGYLNFSSGAADVRFLANLNRLAGEIAAAGVSREVLGRAVQSRLAEAIELLNRTSPAFLDVEQARSVLALVFDHFLPAYREFHRDLLFHQTAADLSAPFFVGRALETVLRQGAPWDETQRIVEDGLAEFNNYVGYRPVAVLHSGQRMEPYPHEWTRPVPLYIQHAGIAIGRYDRLIEQALDLLRETEPALLAASHFHLANLDELALDMRAYEFDHPANKRPNYHFGQWDPHQIDNRGRYRRFVLQQVTLDALISRVEEPSELAVDERLYEAAAVLAGVMLMASATSGSGPGTYDSSVSLATLLPTIAANRDAFYEQLMKRVSGKRAKRLQAQAKSARQPFAAARQHLNHTLARRRATQLEQVHLSLLYARMGHRDAALRQAQAVSVASARMRCEIQCRLTMGDMAVTAGRLDDAARLLVESEDYLHRAIECGALADPWNILGFQGQFSLFPSPENSVNDHRTGQLIELLEQVFGLFARTWSEAAARDDDAVATRVAQSMDSLARWWDRFATTTVMSLESFSGAEAVESGRQVAAALQAWHRGGASSGNIGFWRQYVTHFQSPKAYALVVEALLNKGDLIAARALLMQWLSHASEVPLKFGSHSFHALAERWLAAAAESNEAVADPTGSAASRLVTSFFDYLEANAEELWSIPSLISLEPGNVKSRNNDPTDGAELDDEDAGQFDAAYDDMVYVDSTEDGVEADMLETPGPASEYELEHEGRHLRERLGFLATVAALWKRAATTGAAANGRPLVGRDVLKHWLTETSTFQSGLLRLLDATQRRHVPQPSASRDSLLEFEQRRSLKEALLETIIATEVALSDTQRWLAAVDPEPIGATLAAENFSGGERAPTVGADPGDAIDSQMFHAMLTANVEAVRQLWPQFLERIQREPLLYIPLHKGGEPRRIVTVRKVQQCLRDMLAALPRLGLLHEACQLIDVARKMENDHPVGANAVTEFDRLFSVAYRALVESLVEVSLAWETGDDETTADRELVECLESLTESLLKQWLAHSRTLRLSTLERIANDREWQALVGFVEHYGHDLFTQRFLNLGNLRAIMHQGVDTWLTQLTEQPPNDDGLRLLEDLSSGALNRADAVRNLSLVLEAIIENFTEYRDYNSTTTQSDRGELLYMLLDFIRLRVQYDRVAWHLRPVLLAHEILVRNRREEAAEMWRRALAERTGEVADSLLVRYDKLSRKYAMRLPTIADRLAERFVRPLSVDRLRALVRPAIEEVRAGQSALAFEVLRQEAEELTKDPTGVGLDVPGWLRALEDEVDDANRVAPLQGSEQGPPPIKQLPLTLEEVQRELASWESLPD